MRGCFFLKEEEETATIPHAKLRFTYRQMEISDTCILWGLARLHTLRGIRVWTGSPGNVLSHHFIISLTSAQDENRLSRCDFQFSFFFLQRLCYKRIQAQRRKSPRRFGVHLDSLLNENKSCDREIKNKKNTTKTLDMIRHSLSREQHVFSFGELQIIHSSSQPKCRLEAKAQFSHKLINRILTGSLSKSALSHKKPSFLSLRDPTCHRSLHLLQSCSCTATSTLSIIPWFRELRAHAVSNSP